jgi:hypothetical protein
MQHLNKLKIPFALCLVLLAFGCDIKARLADLPPSANIIDFATLSDSKLKGIPPSVEKRKISTYYIEEKTLFYKLILIEKLRVALVRMGYEVLEVNERRSALFAKKKTPGYTYNTFVGVYYKIDSTANKTHIYLQQQHSKESNYWTADEAYLIGNSIEHILYEK